MNQNENRFYREKSVEPQLRMTFDQAKENLARFIKPNGALDSLGPAQYLFFEPSGDEQACLDGYFSATDLEAIAAYMRGPETSKKFVTYDGVQAFRKSDGRPAGHVRDHEGDIEGP